MVEVQWHRVLSTSHFHSFIKITPEDQMYFKYNPYFMPNSRQRERYLTIGAGSKWGIIKKENGGISMGILTKGYNRTTDWKYHTGKFASVKQPSKYKNEIEFIKKILALHNRFVARLDYDTFPRNKNRSRLLLADDGYNSNSYVAGLLIAAGTQFPKITTHVSGRFKPVPLKYFR